MSSREKTIAIIVLLAIVGAVSYLLLGRDIVPAPFQSSLTQNTSSTSQTEREALMEYFDALSEGRYAEAAVYRDDYETPRSWFPEVNPDDHAELIKRACDMRGWNCLKIRTIVREEPIAGGIKFTVEFTNTDASLFVQGPCCGASEEEMPPRSQFEYEVVRRDGRLIVATDPVYTP